MSTVDEEIDRRTIESEVGVKRPRGFDEVDAGHASTLRRRQRDRAEDGVDLPDEPPPGYARPQR